MIFWLIGNGLSLDPKMLESIDGYSIGVNKIAGIFHRTSWRPTHYCKVDYSQFGSDNWLDEVMPFVKSGIPCLLWDWFKTGLGEHCNITWVERCKHHGEPPTSKYRSLEWHEPFCTAYNSLSVMAQWAVKLGATEIRLLGCDGKFTNGKDDHFMPYYEEVDVGYIERNNSHALAAQLLIKKCCPVPVIDFTPNGIMVFEKRKQ